jgi:alpha-tubulin suppressor-like RCC1 family protein
VACGIDFTLALDDAGRIYSWGNNTFGQLGIPSLKSVNSPKQIEYLANEEIVDISCGDNFAGAISKSGKVYTWGFGDDGQLGHGDRTDQNVPRPLKFEQSPKQISCGGAHTAILTQANELYIFGRGREGQIGH